MECPRNSKYIVFYAAFFRVSQSLFIRTELLKSHPYNETLMIVADYEQMFYEIAVNQGVIKK